MADPEAVVSPGGVGFDINCGVRLLRTNLMEKDIDPVKEKLTQALFDHIPVGVGSKGIIITNSHDLEAALVRWRPVGSLRSCSANEGCVARHSVIGSCNVWLGCFVVVVWHLVQELGMDWSVREGYSWVEDKEHCEEYGRMLSADPSRVSKRAKKRGLPQLGTLGTQRAHVRCIATVHGFATLRRGAALDAAFCLSYVPPPCDNSCTCSLLQGLETTTQKSRLWMKCTTKPQRLEWESAARAKCAS